MASIELILSRPISNADKHYQVMDLYKDWYVECAVTGQPIPLCDLHYWDVDKQEAYSAPEIIPKNK